MEEQKTVPDQKEVSQPITTSQNNSFLVSLLSILLLVSCIIAGFFAWQTQRLVKELNKLNTTQITPTPEPQKTTDPTADWKTYTNNEYGFSFMYPPYLENKGNISGPYTGVSTAIRSFSDPATMSEGTDMLFDGYVVYYVSDINALNFETYLQNEKGAMDNAEYASMTGAKRVSLQNKGVGFVTDTRGYYYFPSNDNKKVVVFGYTQKNQSFKPVFDQILSTFKFTESNTSTTSLPVSCTMDAKICPDGSAVGRSGPKCEFAPCPTARP